MRKIVLLLISLGVAVVAFFGIREAHNTFGSWWLTLYLALVVALPIVFGLVRIAFGAQGIKEFFRSCFQSMLGLLVATLVYQYVTESWFWACLAGLVGVGIVSAVRQWRVITAASNLSQADQLLKAKRPKEALEIAQKVRSIYITRGNRQGQASAEGLMGLAYMQTGENVRAARYLNNALGLYRSLEQEEQAKEVEKALFVLRRRGVDVRASQVEAEPEDGVGRIDWGFVVDGFLGVAFLLIVLRLWEVGIFRTSTVAMAAAAVLLLLLLYGNYAITTLAATREDDRVRRPLLLFNVAWLFLAASCLGFLLLQGAFQVADFPAALQGLMDGYSSLLAGQPGWVLPAVVLGALLVVLAAVVLASGRSPSTLLREVTRGNVGREALQLAHGHLDNKEWGQAITQLSRIDLPGEKDADRRKEALFCLAYAHHQEGHPAEARQYVSDLLGEDPRHQEGLYLAGYLALKDDKLDEAERVWRALYDIAPTYRPPGGSPDQGVDYYLCLALYRQAMKLIDQDFEGGAQLLAEVGELHALDKEVADALIRVHLHRCARLIRERRWDPAAHEVELAQDKLRHLEGLVGNQAEVSVLTGLSHAAQGLVAFRREQYSHAQSGFNQAINDTADIARKGDLFRARGRSFLEQLLRAVGEEPDKDATHKISPAFNRDLYYLKSIVQLWAIQEELSQRSTTSKDEMTKTLKSKVQRNLERSLDIAPDFDEGRAFLGLLYYHLDTDDPTREKGIEILRTVQRRVGSKFVTQTVKEYEAGIQRRADAREAYFDLLQQYLWSATVSRQDREDLRERVLADMKATGEYDAFVGQGSLEIDTEREREPTVQEYMDRAALLRTKLEELQQLETSGQLPARVNALMKQLSEQNQELEKRVKSITAVERELLEAAGRLL